MEIRLILFKEISSGISLNNPHNEFPSGHFLFPEGKTEEGFSFRK
jgi:hypothetical protein